VVGHVAVHLGKEAVQFGVMTKDGPNEDMLSVLCVIFYINVGFGIQLIWVHSVNFSVSGGRIPRRQRLLRTLHVV